MQKEYDFALIAKFSQPITNDSVYEIADSLFEAGCEDCTVMTRNQSLVIEFCREADNFQDAVISAINEINSVECLTVLSLDAGDVVSLSDAAELSGLSRSTLSKYSKGDRGDNTFPLPIYKVQSKTPLYRWSEIAQWLNSQGNLSFELTEKSIATSAINLAINLRNLSYMQDVNRIQMGLN